VPGGAHGLGFLGFLGFIGAFVEMRVFVFSGFLGSDCRGKTWGVWISGRGVFAEAKVAGRDVITVIKYHIVRNDGVNELASVWFGGRFDGVDSMEQYRSEIWLSGRCVGNLEAPRAPGKPVPVVTRRPRGECNASDNDEFRRVADYV
jgi:hypothetical protein